MKNNNFTSYIAFMAAICVLPLFLSGCSDEEKIDIVINETGVVTERTLGYGEEITITEEEEPNVFSDIIASFPIDTILLPDGSSVDKSEANRATVDQYGDIKLEFDFWFMRYAKPVFWSNIEGLGEYREKSEDWKAEGEAFEKAIDVKKEDYFKVKSGDTLENGMRVDKAGFTVTEEGWYWDAYVELSGEVTYEGVIVCYEQSTPGNDKWDIVLLPDPTKDIPVPIIYIGDLEDVKNGEYTRRHGNYSFEDQYINLDSTEITLGNREKLSKISNIDFDDIFIKNPRPEIMYSYGRAKVKIRDISIGDYNASNYKIESFEITD